MIAYMKNHTKGLDLDYEDYLYWLEESLNIAFKYRRWRDSSQQISGNPNAPELIINRAIYSTQRRYYTYYATLKRVGESAKVSIEDLLENRYSVDTALMTHDKHNDADNVDVIISQLINKNKVFEALVIDCIAFGNTITEIKSNKNIKLQFSIKALIKSIESINNEYCLYFAEKYGLSLDYVKQVISDTITSKSHFTVRNKVKHCLKAMQYNEDVISLLC